MSPAKRRAAAPARTGVPLDQLEPAPIVLVSGTEGLLADRAVSKLIAVSRQKDSSTEIERLDASAHEPGQLGVAVSPSLFGGSRVIVVEKVEAANDAFVSEAMAYLAQPEPEACVIIRHGGGQRAKGLLDAIRKSGAPEAVCAPITKDEEKLTFVGQEFRRLRCTIDAQAARALVDALGSDLRELAGACSQLASDVTEKPISVQVIERYFGGRVEVTGFRVADAAVAGQSVEALGLLRHALDTGVDPVPLIAALAAKVRTLAKVRAAGSGRAADLARDLGLAPWQVERAQRDLRGWNPDRLARAVTALAEADFAVKGGGRDPVYAVERAVLTIATR